MGEAANSLWLSESLVTMLERVIANMPADKVFFEYCAEKNLGSKKRRVLSDHFFRMLREYWQIVFTIGPREPELIVKQFFTNYAQLQKVCVVAPSDSSSRPTAGSLQWRVNMPNDLWVEFLRSFSSPEEIPHEVLGRQTHIDIRVNSFAGFSKSFVMRHLCAKGMIVKDLPFTNGLRLTKRMAGIVRLPLYKQGAFELQDWGSQIVTKIAAASIADTSRAEGLRILDYCAGAGGKSLALLDNLPMIRIEELVLADINEARLANAQRRFYRIAATQSGPQTADEPVDKPLVEERFCDKWQDHSRKPVRLDSKSNCCGLEHYIRENVSFRHVDSLQPNETFGLVLVDAPCSGTGTLIRNPWLTIQLDKAQIHQDQRTQLEILQKAAKFVVEGGVLVYITCSLLKSENADVIELFLRNNYFVNGAFELIDIPQLYSEPRKNPSELRGNPDFRGSSYSWQKFLSPLMSGKYVRIFPSALETSGFFMAMLRKL
ncbi:MAG: hypothetical protein LBF72_00490 [Holosporales bacterium]|jgi:16S rRNA (cytosine967-C5)-methyltransferase|nr:hypothetical protein [Holosporales bacterium]